MSVLWRAAEPLILASNSTARQKLLAAAGIPFEICAATIDERGLESSLARADAATVALHLSHAKALHIGAKRPGRLVIGADQTLCLGGEILGKPPSREAAAARLAAMSGRTHELYSGCCAIRDQAILFETVGVARLTCRDLSPAFIEAYAGQAGNAFLSSAGAYLIEDLGIHLFAAIDGDHATILGLPLLPLLQFLREEGSLLG